MPLLVSDDGAVRTLTLSNPKKKNALTRDTLDAIAPALPSVVAGDAQAIRCVIVRGDPDGGAFSSGFDIGAITPDERARGLDPIQGPADALERCPVPVIAAIQGACMGGALELAMACTFRVAANDAVFCMPPARLGLVYSPSGLQRFLRAIGASAAQRLFLAGDHVFADEALALGLCDRTVALAEREVARLAALIAENAPLAVAGLLDAIRRLSRGATADDLSAIEAARARTVASADLLEGVAAFAEKRKPRFTGR